MKFSYVEILGIFSTVLIMVSLMQKDEARLRFINMIGSVLFTVYGLIIGAFSVWLLNGICIFINLYHFIRVVRSRKKKFDKFSKTY